MSPVSRAILRSSSVASTSILRPFRSSPSFSSKSILSAPPSKAAARQITEFDYKRLEPRPTVDYVKSEEDADEILSCLRSNRVTISMEDVVKGYQSVRRGHYEEPITMSVVDGGGVIVIHLGLILKTGKFPAELKKLLEDRNVLKQGFDIIHYCRQILRFPERCDGTRPENLLRLKPIVTMLEPKVYDQSKHPDDLQAEIIEKVFNKRLGASQLNAFEFNGDLRGTPALEFLYNKAWGTHLLARRSEEMLVRATEVLALDAGSREAERIMRMLFNVCILGSEEVERGAYEP